MYLAIICLKKPFLTTVAISMLKTCLNTFAVVEFTVHCQTRLQSKFSKGTVYSCLFFNRYKGHTSLFYISKCSGDIIISYMEDYANFLYKKGLYKNVCNVIRFRDIKQRKHVEGNDIQDAIKPFNCYILIYY